MSFDCLGDWSVGRGRLSSLKLLFTATTVPVVYESYFLERLSGSIGSMASEKQVIPGLDHPSYCIQVREWISSLTLRTRTKAHEHQAKKV